MRTLALLFTCAVCSAVFAQPDTLWTKTFGGDEDDICYSAYQTNDHGFILAGYYSHGSLFDPRDFYVVKLDAAGELEWQRTYGDTYTRSCYTMHPVGDDGYILAGTSNYWLDFDNTDIWLLRINAQGDSLWSRQFGAATAWEQCYDVKPTPDGGFILAGYAAVFQNSGADIWIIKTSAQGSVQWQDRFYDPRGNAVCNEILLQDDGYLFVGYSYNAADESQYALVMKTNLDGDSLWYRQLEAGYCASICEDGSGGFMLAGSVENANSSWDARLTNIDAEGNTNWSRTYVGPGYDYVEGIKRAPDGGYLLVGSSSSFGEVFGDAWVLKVDADGDSLWSMALGGILGDWFYSIEVLDDGGLLFAGSYGVGQRYDFYVVRTEPYLLADPEEIEFGDQFVSLDTVRQVVLRNLSDESVALDAVASNHDEFTVNGFAPGMLLPGDSVVFSVRFAPQSSGLYRDTLLITTQPSYCSKTIPVSGTGVEFHVSCDPENPVLTAVVGESDSLVITIINEGQFDAIIDTVYFNSNSDIFTVSPCHAELPANGQAEFQIVFTPLEAGIRLGEMYFMHDVFPGSFSLYVHGEATISSTNHPGVSLPDHYYLGAIYPNPFNQAAELTFGLPQLSPVTLAVYDITGRLVKTITEDTYTAGVHTVRFDGGNLSSGLYFCTMHSGAFASSRKMVLLK